MFTFLIDMMILDIWFRKILRRKFNKLKKNYIMNNENRHPGKPIRWRRGGGGEGGKRNNFILISLTN